MSNYPFLILFTDHLGRQLRTKGLIKILFFVCVFVVVVLFY